MALLEAALRIPEPAAGELRLNEELGPKGRRRVLIATVASVIAIVGGLWWVYSMLARWRYAPGAVAGDAPISKGQFEWSLWEPFTQKLLWTKAIWPGVLNTVRAFGLGLFLALGIGIVMATWRAGESKKIRFAAASYTEVFRACALVLLIRFSFFQLGRSFPSWNSIWMYAFVAVVIGLTLYYSTVFAEVIRSSINSLSVGQKEAGLAIGMTHNQVLRTVILPQALRRALPNIVTQAASLLKDTSIGYLVTYPELSYTSDIVKQTFDNSLQTYFVFWMVYVFLVACVSSIANRIRKRQDIRK